MLISSRIRSFYVSNRYGFLFFTLLLSLALIPVSRPLHISGAVVQTLLAANLFAGVMALQAGLMRKVTLVALLLALAARPVTALLNADMAGLWSQVVWALFALLMAGSAIMHSLRGRQIGSEQLYAALSAYLLAGLFFGQLYWVIDQFLPGSLGIAAAGTESSLSHPAAVYFSFVTLASLGYGDIVPVSDLARGLAVIEVIGGQLYLAVLVARLVGIVRHSSAED